MTPNPMTHEHEARLVLTRAGEEWGEAVFAILIAPFARDVALHLDELTPSDLDALVSIGRLAQRERTARTRKQS